MRIRVTATFPEAPAGHACNDVTLDARHVRIAVIRGLKQILSNPHLKQRRLRSGVIRSARIDVPDTRSDAGEGGGTQ